MWKLIRILILVIGLLTALQQTWQETAELDWRKNFYVAVFPINADGSAEVAQYIKSLHIEDFEPVTDFFASEGKRYGVGLRKPVEIQLGEEVTDIPPAPPVSGNLFEVMLWSLQFRYYGWVNDQSFNIKPNIKLYLLYYDPTTHPRLSHSTALNKGRIGRINVFGSRMYHQKNLVILAHELLHTVNATDKYNLENTLPQYPDGFAEPNKKPLYPQRFAELMGGRIPVTKNSATIPASLQKTIIGEKTATEIGWIQ